MCQLSRDTQITNMADPTAHDEMDAESPENPEAMSETTISTENTAKNDTTGEDRECFRDGQLSCIGQDVESIPLNLINEYASSTKRLDVSYNRLRSLSGLERFEAIEELILDNNEIDDDAEFPQLKHLHTLTLNKNNITDIDRLIDILNKKYPSLTYLSLLGNKACPNQLSSLDKDEEDYQRYRHYVLYRLPKLKFLDSSPVKQSELNEAKRVGPYTKIIRPSSIESEEAPNDTSMLSNYSPLPDSTRDKSIGTFGISKYVYYGRHSEGNRFIKNNDL